MTKSIEIENNAFAAGGQPAAAAGANNNRGNSVPVAYPKMQMHVRDK